MPEETLVEAAPSVATENIPEIPRSGTSEYAQWRLDGTLPEKKQPEPADSATAEEPTERAGAEPATQQEKPRRKPDAEARIKSLTDRIKQLESQQGSSAKETPAESSPAKPATQKQQFDQKEPTTEDKNADGTPRFTTYEEYTKALARWEIRQEMAEQRRQDSMQAQQRELDTKVSDARARYGDQLDAVLAPTVTRIMGDASVVPTIKAMLNDSDVLPDLLYTLGSDQKALDNFLKMPPGKQIRYLAALESGIQTELSTSTRNDKGQFAKTAETPAKRGPESAPEPPLEIGNRGRATDEPTRALKAIESGDTNAFRAWKQAEDRKAMARRRGA